MSQPILEKYPAGVVLLTAFCNEHPELLPLRRARTYIATLYEQPENIQRIFRKRLGRWHVHVPSLIEYYENPTPVLKSA